MRLARIGSIYLCLMLGPGALAFAPSALARSDAQGSRQESYRYNYVQVDSRGSVFATFGALHIATRARDRYVTLRVSDATALPVGVVVEQDIDGDGGPDVQREVCGRSAKRFAISGGAMLTLHLVYGPCSSGIDSFPTTGRVDVTFHR